MSTGERKFLHDLASPLTIAQGMIDAALELVRERHPVDERMLSRLEKSSKAMERMAEMLRARRTEVVASDGKTPAST